MWAPVAGPMTNKSNDAVPPSQFLPNGDEDFKEEEAKIEADNKALNVLRKSHRVS